MYIKHPLVKVLANDTWDELGACGSPYVKKVYAVNMPP